MLRTVLILAAAALTSPALADCYRGPDTLDTGFAANNVARAVCLQNEVADDAKYRAELTSLQLQIDAMNRQIQLDRMRPPLFR